MVLRDLNISISQGMRQVYMMQSKIQAMQTFHIVSIISGDIVIDMYCMSQSFKFIWN